MRHEIVVNKVSCTYSWHNITPEYDNQTIKCSKDNSVNWNTVTFPNGMYSYSDLNDYLHQIMTNNHKNEDESCGINTLFILSTYKVVIVITSDCQLDLRNTEFGNRCEFGLAGR